MGAGRVALGLLAALDNLISTMARSHRHVPERLRYMALTTALLLRHPTEGFDRLRGRLEMFRDYRLRRAPDRSVFTLIDDPLGALHAAIGVEGHCPLEDSFEKAWEKIGKQVSTLNLPFGLAHDADRSFARVVWCAVLHLRATRIVETGVARGITSAFILEALSLTDEGHLWSVDIPPMKANWRDQAGVAVPEALRDHWTYIRGSSRRRLPLLLTGINELDIFIHDSLHTESTMRFEMEHAWSKLRKGGVMLVDDIEGNVSFLDFVKRQQDVRASFCAAHKEKTGLFGIAVKSS